MDILGFQKTTLLDYPGHVAATVFLGGCNFCCPYCHNFDTICRYDREDVFEKHEIIDVLQKRRGILKGVCITGGEPTLWPELIQFIEEIRKMGYLVKLDTNGSRPEVLDFLLKKGMLDYVAMDIKASRDKYIRACGCSTADLERVCESVDMLMRSSIEYEFRTTLVGGIHSVEDMEQLGGWIGGCKAYYLQNYRENDFSAGKGLYPFNQEQLEKSMNIAKKYIDKVYLRGVE